MKRYLVLPVLLCLALALAICGGALAETGAGYTVEFHRDELEYVLPGDTSVAMSEILATLGLTGEVEAVEVSDASLFSASDETGEWIVTAHRAFSTEEWMKVTIDGAVYDIAVTDTDLSGFLDCTSGSATGYFTYSDHFYKVEWTGINTAETSSVRLDTDSYNRLVAYRNGDASATTFLRVDATSSTAWPTSSITNLTVGQSSSGYTSFWKLATGADDKNRKKVCTVTCVASLKPKWSWADDHKSCTATFFCAADPSVTATVNATITQSIEPLAANATFNGQSYAYKPTETYNINYVLNGGTNAEANPATYRDDEAVVLADPTRTGYVFEGWYNNARFNGSPITEIPYDSMNDKTFYAKWRDEIDGLHYDAGIGGFVIDGLEALNTLVQYSTSNNCSGKVFKQTADIALSGSFAGIGSYNKPFKGTYDGGNHYITGLYVNQWVNYLGFFYMTNGATVENVRIVSPYVHSSNTAGTSFGTGISAVIGSAQNTTVRNCYVLDPDLKGDSSTGAIIGWKLGGTCSDCYYYATSDSLSAIGRSGDSATGRLRKVVLASEHVTISGDAVKLFYDGAYYVTDDSPLTLTVTPDTGYELSELAVKQGTAVVALGETENANEYTFEMPPTGDVTVEATFALIKYTIEYNYNLEGVNIPAGNPASYNIDSDTITLVNPTRAGYAFTGWTGSNGTTPQKTVTIPHGSIGEKAYTANWMEDHWGIAAGNDGSAAHPYIVSTAAGLNYLASYVNSGKDVNGLHFLQTADIALSGTFTPIGGQNGGYNATAFAGVYDGGGHTITGLTVNASSPYAGLFGYIQGGTVKNLTVISPNVKASWSNTRYASGIAGCVKPGYIENCKVLNPTLSATYCGAICGGICARSTSISGCLFYASGNVPGVGMNNLQVPITVTRVNTLTLGEDITAEATSAFSYDGTSYYTEHTSVTLGHTERDGYSFSYVAKGSDNSSVTVIDDQFEFPAKDVTVTGVYTPIVYGITYNDVEGATFTTTYNSYTVESPTFTLDRPTKTGYTFGGWYRKADLTGDAVAAIATGATGNETLWAKWTANSYTVHFEANCDRASGTMADQSFQYNQNATALSANAFSVTTGEFLGWNTAPDGKGTAYTAGQTVQNLTTEDGAVITLYAQWKLMHRFNYDRSIFSCKNLTQTAYHPDTPEVYWAYEGDTVEASIIDSTHEYTVTVTRADGNEIDYENSTFTMPNQEVWINTESRARISYTTVLLDGHEGWEDVAYLYDPANPTVTPVVEVWDGETELIEGTDYTLSIINNTGNASGMVTATVTVTGMGDYIGVNEENFRITPFDIAECEIGGKLETYDDGYGPSNVLNRNVQILHGQTPLTYEEDYIIDLDHNIGVYDYEVGETYTATVIGRGEWGGQTTFTFLMTELAHTVVYDAGDAGEDSGTMPDDTAIRGQRFYLPECGFTAPRGMTFDHWEVYYKGIEENPIKNPGDYFSAPYIYDENGVQTITVTAIWTEKDPFAISAPGLAHGSLLVNGDEAVELIDDTAYVYDGDRITIVPNDGYTLSLDDIRVVYYDEEENEHTVSVSPDEDIPGGFTFTMPAADVNVAAELVPIPEYTVSFAANGGSGNMAPETLRVDTEYTLPDCGFTAPADKQFLEWSVKVGEDAAAIMDPGDAFTVTADTTVTAMWVNLYSITVVTKGEGTLTPSKTKAVAGEVITLTANPGEGYALAKSAGKLYAIYANPNGSTEKLASFDREDLSLTTPEGNVTVYAAFISPWEQLQEALSAGGTVTLDRDYEATATDYQLYIPEGTTVTLDLNGHTLDATATNYNVISIYGALTLEDNAGGTITGGSNDGAGVQVSAGASFTMNGGEISGNAVGRNDGMGGGVYVSRDGSFTMNGGTITGNSATTGGGVFNMGSFTMNGGTITGNSATTGAGVAAYSNITLSGAARIDGNANDDVALVYVKIDGELIMDSKIVVGGVLTDAAQHPIAVRYVVDGDDAPDAMVFTEGLSGNGSAACFASVDGSYRLRRLNSDGEAELYKSVDILTLDESGNPVYGARMMILDEENGVANDGQHQWPSGEDAYSFSNFTVGETYTLKTQAPAGYELPSNITFSVDSTGTLTASGNAIDANGALVMTFRIASYDLNVPVDIAGGEVTVTVNGEEATTAHMDDTICVTFTPANGFDFSHGGAVRADGSGIYVDWADDYMSFSFPMPAQSVTLDVGFRRVWAGADFTLPAALTQVDVEAFTGIAATAVLVPEGCTAIGARAFANCDSLEAIRIENANCAIGENAFAGCGTVYVFAPAGGAVQRYCEAHDNCVFVPDAASLA